MEEQQDAVILGFPMAKPRRPIFSRPMPEFQETPEFREARTPEALTPTQVRTQIFNVVRYISYSRVNEVETIEALIAQLVTAIEIENERFPEVSRLKAHSIEELARQMADWSWKNKRKDKVEVPACKANDLIEHAIAEIRILAPHGKAFALLQLFRKNHAGDTFLIQPEKMARACYSETTWTIKNYKEARDVLLREGFIAVQQKYPHSRTKATKYVLRDRSLTEDDRRMNEIALKHIFAR